jgi:flagellar biosynthesis component FlhA
MASNTAVLGKTGSTDWVVPVATVTLIFVMIVPVPAFLVGLLLATSLTFGVIALLSSLYILRPAEFSVFPTLLLFLALFRISLNIASRRQILLHGNEGPTAAGSVIASFGQFVVGGNYVVGFVIFIALISIQYLAIDCGAVRTAAPAIPLLRRLLDGLQRLVGDPATASSTILLCHSPARFHLRRPLVPFLPRVVVLAPAEIPPGVTVQSLGVIR